MFHEGQKLVDVMKASELRIGNLVDIIGRSRKFHMPLGAVKMVGSIDLFKVTLYDPSKPFAVQEIPTETDISDLSPIPLNEEWLLKFGFEKRDNCYRLDSGAGSIVIDVSDILTAILGDGVYIHSGTSDHLEHGFYSAHIEYIHQLQNLYFALTGEELTVKD